MILKNVKIFSDGLIREGAILIGEGTIKKLIFKSSKDSLEKFIEENEDGNVIECGNKLIIPGIIDIHSHLRDMGQSEKETFFTGTQAAAFSGITTVLNMPNTDPPAINAETIKVWMNNAEKNININVGFIAGVPKEIDEEEIKKIIELGIYGFKIYPLNSLNGIDWCESLNIQKLLKISSKFQIPIFIHPDWPLPNDKKEQIIKNHENEKTNILELHDRLYPVEMEAKYVKFIIDNYITAISENNLSSDLYPIIHFCHISNKYSYFTVKDILKANSYYKISFEVTPHHLLLSKDINLINSRFGKVLPPLRESEHSQFLFKELVKGNINLIGTDHAPHTIEEKSNDYFKAPSGFPGFETYPLLLLNKVCSYELSLETFIKVASENPAQIFNFKKKGFIKEGFDADLVIIDKVPEYSISSKNFYTKSKYSPYENFKTHIQIWKVFIRGNEVNIENSKPEGKIIKRLL